jgi:hypothetical protein
MQMSAHKLHRRKFPYRRKAIYFISLIFEFHSMEINLRNAFNTLYDPIFECEAPTITEKIVHESA